MPSTSRNGRNGDLGGLRENPWTSLCVLALGFFMTMLDLSIVNIAIPDMVTDLQASLADVLWAVNAYIIVVAVLLITTGRLGDFYGARRLFIVGNVVFVAFSLLCGLAQSPSELIAARALQGLGAALLLPQTMAMIVRIFPPEQRGAALGIWGAVGGVAAIAGPAVGGLLVSSWGWRWIFFVNVPVGFLVIVLANMAIPNIRNGRHHKLDVGGVLLSSAGLLCLTFALMEGQRFHWNAWIFALLAAGVGFVGGFVLHQRGRQSTEPLVPFILFRDRDYTAMNVVAAMISISIVGLMLLLTIFFQSVLGFSALKAGLAIAPASLISTVIAPLSGRLSDRFDGKQLLLAGLLLSAVGMVWAILVMEEGAAWSAFLAPMIVIGLGNGFLIAPMSTVAMHGIQPQLAGAASGVMNTSRQLGSVVGVTLVGALIQYRLSTGPAGEIPPDTYVDAVHAVHTAMAVPIVAILVGAAACVTAQRTRQPAEIATSSGPPARDDAPV